MEEVNKSILDDKAITTKQQQDVIEHWQNSVHAMETTLKPLIALADTPSTISLANTFSAHMGVIDEVFDMLERHLQNNHGIAPVKARTPTGGQSSIRPTVSPSGRLPTDGVTNLEGGIENGLSTPLCKPPSMRLANSHTRVSKRNIQAVRTPPHGQRPVGHAFRVDDASTMPKTPRLEDFGLDADFVRSLQEQKDYVHDGDDGVMGSAKGGGGQKVGTDKWGNDHFLQDVHDSMKELGIETPQQVNDRYGHKRHVALRDVMANCTPGLKSGHRDDDVRVEDDGDKEGFQGVASLSELADGYNANYGENTSSKF